jgi:hypothetical protein
MLLSKMERILTSLLGVANTNNAQVRRTDLVNEIPLRGISFTCIKI